MKKQLSSIIVSLFWVSRALASGNECQAAGDSGVCRVNTNLPLLHPQGFYINGTWVQPSQPRRTLPVIDPSTAEPIVDISLGGQTDTDLAVRAASDAFVSWSQQTTPAERKKYLERLLEIYIEREEDMARLISMEMGAPIDMARDGQAGSGTYHIETFLELLDHFEYERTLPHIEDEEEALTTILMEPIGVVAMITPWNWPMNQIALKVIPALAVGCTCVLKPSEIAPLSALLFAEMIHQAGFPPGVFNLVNGDGPGVGTQLSSHEVVDMVSFTGSTRAGAAVTKAAADTFKRVSLELGGKGANILFADLGQHLEEVVENGVYDCFGNSGQSCNAPTRMLVERSVYDAAVRKAKEVAESVQVKSAHEEGDHLGPVVSEAQFETIQRYIQFGIDEGARLVIGGLGRPEGTNQRGYYVRPTVFADCRNNMTIMREEIFGPVLCITPFDSEDEAIEIANDTPYGLTNYVHTVDLPRRRRLARALRSGMVEMNSAEGDDGSPFGGMKASGNGREGGIYGLEEFCEVKAVTGYNR